MVRDGRGLLDFLVDGVALEEGVILLLLDALGDGLLVTEGQVTGGGLALFFGFGALKGDEFLHGWNWLKGRAQRPPAPSASPDLQPRRTPCRRRHPASFAPPCRVAAPTQPSRRRHD